MSIAVINVSNVPRDSYMVFMLLTKFDNWTDYCACDDLYNEMTLTRFGVNNH